MKRSVKAFTFVELIVVTSIALVVMSVVWGFFSGFLRISKKGSGTVSALTEMSIAFSWLRRDLSNVIIHEPVTDATGKVHYVDIKRVFSEDGSTQELEFYSVHDVIEQNAKPVSGIIKYTLNKLATGYSLKRSLHEFDGSLVRSKTFLKGKISKFAIEFYKHSENEPSALITNETISVVHSEYLPDSMKVIIEQDDASRINAAIAINSPYVGTNNNDNYYASWLLQNIPFSGSSPQHIPRYVKKKTINIKGYGTAISSWDDEEDEE